MPVRRQLRLRPRRAQLRNPFDTPAPLLPQPDLPQTAPLLSTAVLAAVFLAAFLAASLLTAALPNGAHAQGSAHAQSKAEPSAAVQPPPGYSRLALQLQNEFAEVYTHDLTGDGLQELIVVTVELETRRTPHHTLRVFVQERRGGYTPLPSATQALPESVSLAGVGVFRHKTIKGGSAKGAPGLALLMPGRVSLWPWRGDHFDPTAETSMAVSSVFPVPNGELKTGLQWLVDLDRDGLSELLVPRFDGLDILRQDNQGGLYRHGALPFEPHAEFMNWFYTRRRMISYTMPTVAVLDLDGQGWLDVLIYQRGELRGYLLGAAPRQDGTPAEVHLDLQPPRPFDPAQPHDPPLVLIKATDMNADGSVDLVFTKTSTADSQFNSSTTVLLYYGRSGQQGAPLDFGQGEERRPDQAFVSEGFGVPLVLDLNGDQTQDLVLVNVEIGFWNAIKALIARSVNAEAAYYLMPKGGRYPAAPDEVRSYTVKFSLGRYSHQPIFAFGDMNADGLPDLLLSLDKERIGIHWGRERGFWAAAEDTAFSDFLPTRTERVRVTDLNGDQRDDLLLLYNRDDAQQMPSVLRTLTVLQSRPPLPIAHGQTAQGQTAQGQTAPSHPAQSAVR